MFQEIQQKTRVDLENDDFESIFSLEKEPTDKIVFALQTLVLHSDDEIKLEEFYMIQPEDKFPP